MSPIRRVARPLLAATFIAGGAGALVKPAPQVERVRAAGLTQPERLVRANAALMVVSGMALATGRFPRLAALALSASLVPTTAVGHPFWAEKDPDARRLQQSHVMKNLGLLGGLLMAVADTGGRESVPHAAGRMSRRARRRLGAAT
ncbi:MAG: DoxX family protein [Actinomycetota bacterium]|nr:DoxX family protein [Actinomycetota bacterium]